MEIDERMTTRSVISAGASAAGLLLGVSIAHAAAVGATGKIQIGEQQFVLSHAFAVMEQDMLAEGDKNKLTVLLTDKPVPDELRKASRAWFYWAEREARAGQLHGLILTIDPETGIWDRGQLLTESGFMLYSESVSSRDLSQLQLALDGKPGDHVAGKVSMKESMPTMQDDISRWTVAAEFNCEVIPRPTVSGSLTGAAALDSPQLKAVRAFLDACKKGDADAILKSVDPQAKESMASTMAANKSEALKMFAGMAAETSKLNVGKITVRGDSAEVEFVNPKSGSGDKQSLRVVLVEGEWKLAQ
jgi:hypothetical protein